jgi:hypothetical protein
MLKKVASIVVALAIIGLFFGLISFSTFLYAQIPPITLGIKITSPSTGQQVPTGELTISGISTDNVNTDCTIYTDWNNTKPFQTAVATGPGGVNDYSTWTFTYTDDYHLITNGTNDLTSKLSCIDDSNGGTTNLTKSYSVNVIGVNLDDNDNRTNVSANYTIPPIVNVPPQPIIVEATNQSGALVNYNVSATDNNDMFVVPICDPPSGSSFSLGNTTVNCTVTDNDGNSAVASFSVIVEMPTRAATTFTITESGTYNETPNAVVGAAAATDVNTCNKNLEISEIISFGDDGEGDDAIETNILDDNLNTRWSAETFGSWIQTDLGIKNVVCSLDIAWYKGNTRSYNFIISLSTDGTTYTNVYEGTSSGKTLSSERYNFKENTARYVKITINGNNEDGDENWGAITEIDINGYDISSENKPTSPNTIRLNISGNYEHNSVSSGAGGLKIDPSNIEGSIALINSTTNKKIEEYDLAPIDIIVTQLFKKITIKTQLDDPITSGTVNATLNFISPIDFQTGGSYSSTATDRNILMAEVNGKTYDTKGTAEGKITISIP